MVVAICETKGGVARDFQVEPCPGLDEEVDTRVVAFLSTETQGRESNLLGEGRA